MVPSEVTSSFKLYRIHLFPPQCVLVSGLADLHVKMGLSKANKTDRFCC